MREERNLVGDLLYPTWVVDAGTELTGGQVTVDDAGGCGDMVPLHLMEQLQLRSWRPDGARVHLLVLSSGFTLISQRSLAGCVCFGPNPCPFFFLFGTKFVRVTSETWSLRVL